MQTILMLLLFMGILFPKLTDENLDLDEFKKLHKQLQPQKKAWKTIPWHLDLKTAQKQAADEKKLLFIWAMDGHPLGCT